MKKISPPLNSQILIFPMIDCTVSAGFKNIKYKRHYKYIHYGTDFDSKRAVDFDVIASGNGEVLDVEKNKNSIGGVVIIRYNKVYNPSKNIVQDLILRYLHLYSINVKKGDKVKAYQVIGTVSGSHTWWNHVHVEVDTDVKYPFHTVQVAEKSSKRLIRKGATAKTLHNPMSVFVIGKNQAAKIHSLATFVDHSTDAPRFMEK